MTENNESHFGEEQEFVSATSQGKNLNQEIADIADAIEGNLYDPKTRREQVNQYTALRIQRDGIDSVPPGAIPGSNPYSTQAEQETIFSSENTPTLKLVPSEVTSRPKRKGL